MRVPNSESCNNAENDLADNNGRTYNRTVVRCYLPSRKARESNHMIPKLSDARLLILSCSRRKRAGSRLLPALERYDGPAFQVLRKFIIDCPATALKLDIRILSAKFGLIPADRLIPCYDQPMTINRATALHPTVLLEVKRLFARHQYRKLMINIGRDYLPALSGYELLVADHLEVSQAAGSSGRRQTMLRDWLRGKPLSALPIPSQGRARIREIEIMLTPAEVMEKACRALAAGNNDSQAYQSWYVQLAGQRVSPKWLVHQLTGLSVGEFHSDEARRVLAQLGVEVKRV